MKRHDTSIRQSKGSPRRAGSEEKEAIRVYLRVRPKLKQEAEETCISIVDETSVKLQPTSVHDKETQLWFSKVFDPAATQKEVYEATAQPLVETLFAGHNGLLFAYGITNSGKTHTIQGSERHPGVVRRSIAEMLHRIQDEAHIELRVSFLEIYNEKVFDLLSSRSKGEPLRSVTLSVAQGGRVVVRNATEVAIGSMERALQTLHLGEQNRKVAETAMNVDSSRSHVVFTIALHDTRSHTVSKLCIVDLAGAERSSKSGSNATRFQEAVKINSSLLVLGRCLTIMQHNACHPESPQVVPYRESRITLLLKDYFEGWGKVAMIATASNAPALLEDTRLSLNYASIARKVQCVSRINTGSPSRRTMWTQDDAVELCDEILGLRQEQVRLHRELETLEYEVRHEMASEAAAQIEEMEQDYHRVIDRDRERLTRYYEGLLEIHARDAARLRDEACDGNADLADRAQRAVLEVECDTLRSKLSLVATENQELQASIQQLKRQLTASRAQVDAFQQTSSVLRNEESRRQNVESDIDAAYCRIDELQHTLEDTRRQSDTYRDLYESLQLASEESGLEVETLHSAMQSMETEREALQSQLQEAQGRIEALTRDLSRVCGQTANLEASLAEANASTNTAQTRIEELQRQSTSKAVLEERVEELEEKCAVLVAEKETLQAQVKANSSSDVALQSQANHRMELEVVESALESERHDREKLYEEYLTVKAERDELMHLFESGMISPLPGPSPAPSQTTIEHDAPQNAVQNLESEFDRLRMEKDAKKKRNHARRTRGVGKAEELWVDAVQEPQESSRNYLAALELSNNESMDAQTNPTPISRRTRRRTRKEL